GEGNYAVLIRAGRQVRSGFYSCGSSGGMAGAGFHSSGLSGASSSLRRCTSSASFARVLSKN
ncbi:hypothetical protein, partial [Salmonella enterica]|uniref:hypothetical protein n=1 Tax=Salmonella enterica TaxID=28901 RepID=UPI002ADEC1DA